MSYMLTFFMPICNCNSVYLLFEFAIPEILLNQFGNIDNEIDLAQIVKEKNP